MSETEVKAKKPTHKVVSNIVSGVLGGLILLLIVFQVLMVRSSTYTEFGVPSLFGTSFMQVATDSMEGDLPDSLKTYTGVIMKQTPSKDIKTDDVITFKSAYLSRYAGYTVVVSHRVKEIVLTPSEVGGMGGIAINKAEEYSLDSGTTWATATGEMMPLAAGKGVKIRLIEHPDDSVLYYTIPNYSSSVAGEYIFYACGDNLKAETCKLQASGVCSYNYRDEVEPENYIGKIIAHNDALGAILGVAMSTWFVPVACLVPLLLIVTFSAIDLVKDGKKEQFEEERQILLAANKAGVNPNDERAYYLFSEKQRYKIQVRSEMEKTKAEQKKRILKEMKKKGEMRSTMEVKS